MFHKLIVYMSGYSDVRMTTSTVSSGGGGSAWGSGVFRNDIQRDDRHERISFVDDHDRRPVEKNGFNINKVCYIACSVLTLTSLAMVLIDLIVPTGYGNSTNSSNTTQLLRA